MNVFENQSIYVYAFMSSRIDQKYSKLHTTLYIYPYPVEIVGIARSQ